MKHQDVETSTIQLLIQAARRYDQIRARVTYSQQEYDIHIKNLDIKSAGLDKIKEEAVTLENRIKELGKEGEQEQLTTLHLLIEAISCYDQVKTNERNLQNDYDAHLKSLDGKESVLKHFEKEADIIRNCIRMLGVKYSEQT